MISPISCNFFPIWSFMHGFSNRGSNQCVHQNPPLTIKIFKHIFKRNFHNLVSFWTKHFTVFWGHFRIKNKQFPHTVGDFVCSTPNFHVWDSVRSCFHKKKASKQNSENAIYNHNKIYNWYWSVKNCVNESAQKSQFKIACVHK